MWSAVGVGRKSVCAYVYTYILYLPLLSKLCLPTCLKRTFPFQLWENWQWTTPVRCVEMMSFVAVLSNSKLCLLNWAHTSHWMAYPDWGPVPLQLFPAAARYLHLAESSWCSPGDVAVRPQMGGRSRASGTTSPASCCVLQAVRLDECLEAGAIFFSLLVFHL